MKSRLLQILALISLLSGCNIEDIPPAHKAWVFEQSMVGESNGFIGEILDPGSRAIGFNNDFYLVQCGETTIRESLDSASQDGVTFGSDTYTRIAVNCDNKEAVKWILKNVQPNPSLTKRLQLEQQATNDKDAPQNGNGQAPAVEETRGHDHVDRTVTIAQLYYTYVRPVQGQCVRTAMSKVPSNDINSKREDIGKEEEECIRSKIDAMKPPILKVAQFDLSKITFPETMQGTMNALANVKTEKQLEIEKTGKVAEQINRANKEKELADAEANKTVSNIDRVGDAIAKNPHYLEYLRIQQQPELYKSLGTLPGTLVLGGDNANIVVGKK